MHYSCCTGSGGAANSRVPLAVAAVAAAGVRGSAGCRVIDAGAGPAGWGAGVRGSGPAPETGLVPTGGESRDGVAGVGVVVAGGGLHRA